MALRPYDELSVMRARILKAKRAEIRLKHSLAADEEIARVLPELDEQITAALQNGDPLEIEAL